jgi:hypothetical protein
MRLLIPILVLLPSSVFAQSSGTCANPFESAAGAGHEIAMNLRSGDVTIVGTDASVVRVSCSTGSNDAPGQIRITFAANHLTIRGGTSHDVHFRIEIPRSTSLLVRCSAGDVTISGITGDKDIGLNAGNLTIAVGDAASYRHAQASVLAGDLHAPAFGIEKDGLFRNFRHDNPAGRYRLRADLLAGDLTLR